ncbi:rab9 effector protein with kelch motifs [Echinococcus multilocularis]|uniref:Rab9 effector protein with kelch motifs n=1 Tax=Echinococcus multilocularis TaxID=6211 RepID=A0A068Y2N8_ECHMU|nr:rab9 effector protein with kelch motifs [Echinococcus multilocularis]
MSMDGLPLKLGSWHKCDIRHVDKDITLARVGHTAHHLHTDDNLDWLLLIGGASFSSCCKDCLLYSVRNGQVCPIESADSLSESGFERYEHASVLLDNELVIFGGATAEGPLNDVIHAKLEVETSASLPGRLFASSVPTAVAINVAPRTQHTAACLTSTGELVVFAGGDRGSVPVDDQKVHLYDVKTSRWRVVEVQDEGRAPCRRMGHLMLPLPSPPSPQDLHELTTTTLYVHGGMAGNDFFDDLFYLSIERTLDEDKTRVVGEWHNIRTAVTQEGPWPSPRAGHGGAFIPSSSTSFPRLFIFGGVNADGPLNDIQYFDKGSMQWTAVMSEGEVPKPCLDFAFTTLRLRIPNPKFSPQLVLDSNDPSTERERVGEREESLIWCSYLFIHGGMDAGHEVFHDAYLCCFDDV